MAGKALDDENTQAVQREYHSLAADYDRRWAAYLEKTTAAALSRLDLRPGERLLDLGCGTGCLLDELAGASPQAHLCGVDVSREMLAVARRKLDARITLVTGDAQHLPFASKTFDVVVSCSALHFWSRPRQALAEVTRLLQPRGRILIVDWCGDYPITRLYDLFLRHWASAHQRTYRTSDCRDLLDASGFTAITTQRFKISWCWGIMAVRASLRLADKGLHA